MNDKRKIEINIVEFQTYKILIQINSNIRIKLLEGSILNRIAMKNNKSVFFVGGPMRQMRYRQ
jgi:hypothetical protein